MLRDGLLRLLSVLDDGCMYSESTAALHTYDGRNALRTGNWVSPRLRPDSSFCCCFCFHDLRRRLFNSSIKPRFAFIALQVIDFPVA